MRGAVGDKCCECLEEAVEKVHQPVHNWICQRAWEVAAESRWSHSTGLLLRYFLGGLAKRTLPRSLSSVQVNWGLDHSMAFTLAKLIAADKEDWSARSKLRLLRLVEVLCPRSAMAYMAAHLQAVRHVDAIMFASLGDKSKHKPPITLAEFVLPGTSPIENALRNLLDMCENWRPCKQWALLSASGMNMWDDADLRQRARKQCFQLSAGHGNRTYTSSHRLGVRPEPFGLGLTPRPDPIVVYVWFPQE